MLSGCNSQKSEDTNTGAVNSAVQLPTYIPYEGLKPDLPGTEQGVDPAFRTFPADNPKAVPEAPGNGDTVTAMANIYFAAPPGPGPEQRLGRPEQAG